MLRLTLKLLPWTAWGAIFIFIIIVRSAPEGAQKAFLWAIQKTLSPATPEPMSNPVDFSAPSRYFPEGSLSPGNSESDKFLRGWFSKQLTALQEPSLLDAKTESYRFLYLRTFHTPVSVRVFRTEGGKWQVTAKRTSGNGGYGPGELEYEKSKELSRREVAELQRFVTSAAIWQNRVRDEGYGGLDGADWIIEANKGANYAIFVRHSGGEDPNYIEFCRWLLRLGHVDHGPIY